MSSWTKKIRDYINKIIYPYQIIRLRNRFEPSQAIHYFNINEADIEPGFYQLEETSKTLQARVSQQLGLGARLGENVHLHFAPSTLKVPFESLFATDEERIILETTKEIIDRLPSLKLDHLHNNNLGYGETDWPTYLKVSAVRVLLLFREFKSYGLTSGTILEIGGLFGTFGLPLQRLGYQVTLVDRYANYSPALDPICHWLEREGLTTVRTTREDEDQDIGLLGTFDAVISMAVIEHIPHTPRFYLEMLRSHAKPETGLIALDTPNLGNFWYPRYLIEGSSIFQDIKLQFYSEIPFEGHHREYTGKELKWILEEIGLREVSIHYFDYNIFQYESLSGEILDSFLSMLENPKNAGLIMGLGRVKP